ncbi:O-acetyltransferase OatA [Abditibacteriota bacterium]|nr:O-acetyltransferase OatA [Abditibacteriota bacterium]
MDPSPSIGDSTVSHATISGHNALSPSERSVPLDFLRAVAVLSVLLHHNVIAWEIAGPWGRIGKLFARDGWLGVDLFFVLSGFLIGGLLFREIKRHGALDVKRFLVRRGLKIWPAYYALLIFTAIWAPITPFGERQPFYASWLNWLHLQNYYHTPLGHTWSLAVEEHFYLMLPLALLCGLHFESAPKKRLKFFPWLVVIVLMGCLGLRFNTHAEGDYWFWIYGTPTHLRMDSLIFGVGLAYLFHYFPDYWNRLSRYGALWMFIAIGVLAPMLVINRQSSFALTWGFTLAYLGFGALLIACVGPQDRTSRWRERLWSFHPVRWLATLGAFSYGIYLWHHDIARPLFHWLWVLPSVTSWPGSVRWLLGTSTYIIFAVTSGILLSRIIEVPFLKWRERLYPPKDGRGKNSGLLSPEGKI